MEHVFPNVKLLLLKVATPYTAVLFNSIVCPNYRAPLVSFPLADVLHLPDPPFAHEDFISRFCMKN